MQFFYTYFDRTYGLVRKIISNPFIFIDGISRGCGLIATFVFANQAGLEEFGRFSFLLGVAAFLRPIGSLELHRVFEKQLSGSETHFVNYFYSCLFVFLCGFSFAAAIAIFLSYYSIEKGIVLLVVMQLLFVLGTREIISGFSRVFDSKLCYSTCELCFNFIPLAGVLAFLSLNKPLDSTLFANFHLVGSLLACFTVIFFIFKRSHKISSKLFIPNIKTLLPFILDAYKSGMFQSIDKIMLVPFVGFADLGLWALCQKVASPIRVFPQSVLRGVRRELVINFHLEGVWDRKMSRSFYAQSVFLIIAYILPAQLLLHYFFDGGAVSFMLFLVLAITMIFRLRLLQFDLIIASKGQSRWLLVDTVVGIIVLPPILYLLVSTVGILGVAVTQLAMVFLSIVILSKEELRMAI